MAAKKPAPKVNAKTEAKAGAKPETKTDLVARYECNGFRFPDRDYYDRHVVFDHVVAMETATQRERFERPPGRAAPGRPRSGAPHIRPRSPETGLPGRARRVRTRVPTSIWTAGVDGGPR